MAVRVIENISISALDNNTARIAWIGEANARAWIALDGKWVAQRLRHDGTAKEADINLPTATPRALDVVECGTAETPTVISAAPELRPFVYFEPGTSASSYRVYCEDARTGTEHEMARIGESGQSLYFARPPANLDGENGVWYRFRAAAVDAFGNEETTESRLLYVMDVPPAPGTVETATIDGNIWLYIGSAPIPAE